MIGIDTNILVRYLTQDDPEQFQQAVTVLEQQCTVEVPGYISTIVLCELMWVLQRAYNIPRMQQADVINRLLHVPTLKVAQATVVRHALDDFQQHSADFADCLIGRLHQAAGCTTTVTLDRKAGRLETFEAL